MIVLPSMPPEQTASWMGLLDLHERLPHAEDSLDRLVTAAEL